MSLVQTLSDFSVRVVQVELLRLVGYKTHQQPDEKLRALMAEAVAEAEVLARPRALVGLFEKKDVPEGTHLSTFFAPASDSGRGALTARTGVSGADVAGAPAGATAVTGVTGAGTTEAAGLPGRPGGSAPEITGGTRRPKPSIPPALEVALSVCTIGAPLEERVSEYSSAGELTRSLILDAAGSVLTEAVCDYANEKICGRAVGRSLYTTRRVSPGYGRWKIEEQKVIFQLLPADSIGVTLTKSYMMIPRKSVSFAVRLTAERPTGQFGSPCATCGREGCEFRR
ncbi:MAG: hypothetical protein JW952_08385 [Candidatus Eisenbacteria bacterium]|nr:hypothetical protein [Candidatus Eisenbacteria bacterium]